jgi:hypothetical protein
MTVITGPHITFMGCVVADLKRNGKLVVAKVKQTPSILFYVVIVGRDAIARLCGVVSEHKGRYGVRHLDADLKPIGNVVYIHESQLRHDGKPVIYTKAASSCTKYGNRLVRASTHERDVGSSEPQCTLPLVPQGLSRPRL